jgi:hypothetical protein
MLAYLPQRLAELSAIALFVGALIASLPPLLTGRASYSPSWPPWRIRSVAAAGLLLLTVLVIITFVTDAEPPGGLPQGHWGDHTDRLFFAGWLAFLAAIVSFNVWREVRFHRRSR